MKQPNDQLLTARVRNPSRAVPGEPMSRQEPAEAVNTWLRQTTGKHYSLDAHTIARYERGKVRRPGAHYRAALRHVLDVATDAELGFRPNRSDAPNSPRELVSPSGDDLGVSPTEFVNRLVIETPLPSRVGWTDVEQVRATTRALAMSENMFGGGLSCEAAAGQLRWAARLLEARADTPVREAVLEAVGNLAGVVGFSAFDIGNQTAASKCFKFALWCAEEGRSWSLRAAALADMARQAMYLGDLDDALSLIEFAQVRSDRLTATGRAMLSTVRARLLGRLGRHDDAIAEVARADAHFADHSPDDDPPWLVYYDEAEHHGVTGRALAPIAIARREPGAAAERLGTAVRLHSADYPRSRAFSRIRPATLLVAAGDPHEAVSIGRQAVAEAAPLHSDRLALELRNLARASVRHGHLPEVEELRHTLNCAFAGT